ncbi:MAG: 4Fe-4S binding protein [Nitrososphaerota archaeon]|nr:4Fe-4S binding protein [Nitrososphaerota archaeon]
MHASKNNIGLFICKCDVDVKTIDYYKLEHYLKNLEPTVRVFFIRELCKNPSTIRDYVKSFNLDSILVVGCFLYKDLMIDEVEGIGLNPLQVEVIPHRELFTNFLKDSRDIATMKLATMIYSSIEKLKLIELVRQVKPRRVRSHSRLSRRSLLRAIPQFLTVYEPTPIVYREKCIGTIACNFCINVCPKRALSSLNDGNLKIDNEVCSLCGICTSVCPTGAIQIPNATDEQIEAQVKKILQNFSEEIPCKLIVFIDSENYRRVLEETIGEKANLPLEFFPIELPTLGLLSENHLLAPIAYGACSIIIITGHEDGKSLEYLDMLRRKITVAENILKAVGFSSPPIYLIEFKDLKIFLEDLKNLKDKHVDGSVSVKGVVRDYEGDRRTKLIYMIKDLSRDNKIVGDVVRYEEPCPFAEVVVDRDRCTLCGVCYEKCPTKSFVLTKEVDMMHLGFIYQKCLGCNLCTSICPENAITLRRYFSIHKLVDDKPILLVSQELLKCSRCSRPFITRGKLMKLRKMYGSLGVGDLDKLQSLKLCPECRRSKIVPAEYDKWFIYR